MKDNRLKSFMDTINDEISIFKKSMIQKFNDMNQEVLELKQSLEFSHAEIVKLKNTVNTVFPLENRVESIQAQLNQSTDLLVYLDNQMRRNHLRMEGVNEIEGES